MRGNRAVQPGRYTSAPDAEEVTVFLIGMRFNRWWKLRSWWPVFSAMPGMLRQLASDPSSGLLSYQLWLGRTTILLSYWRSADHVGRFARDPDLAHLPAWRSFNAAVGGRGDVGVWHETYVTRPGAREVVYVNMPPFGLGAAVGTGPIGSGTATAVQRMRAGGTGTSGSAGTLNGAGPSDGAGLSDGAGPPAVPHRPAPASHRNPWTPAGRNAAATRRS